MEVFANGSIAHLWLIMLHIDQQEDSNIPTAGGISDWLLKEE
jgi:hypothetical protein